LMQIVFLRRCLLRISLLLVLVGVGCEGKPEARPANSGDQPLKVTSLEKTETKPPATANASSGQASQLTPSKKVPLGGNVWFATEGSHRRVLVGATVCLREGGIECFLCRSRTKEYESILSTEADAQVIHAGLLAAGAKP